jgi:hypothetical protein
MHIGTSLRGGSAVKRCKHGFVSSPEEERICAEVIQEFLGHNDDVSRLAEVILAAISATQEEYAHVWNGSTEKVVSFLLCYGTRHTLEGKTSDARPFAWCVHQKQKTSIYNRNKYG